MNLPQMALLHYKSCPHLKLRALFLFCCLLNSPLSVLFLNYFQILDVGTKGTSATVYVLEDSFIKSIKAEENFVFILNYRRKTGAKIVSK